MSETARTSSLRTCKICGCTDVTPCIGADDQPCYWVENSGLSNLPPASSVCSCCTPSRWLTQFSFVDLQGGLHIHGPKALEHLGLPVTPENVSMLMNQMEDLMRKHHPQTKYVQLP